jgi:hypothetical protein
MEMEWVYLAVGLVCCGGMGLAVLGVVAFLVLRKKKGADAGKQSTAPFGGAAVLGEIQVMDDPTASDAPPPPKLGAQPAEGETTSPMETPAPPSPVEESPAPRRAAQTIIAFDDDFDDEEDD